MTAALETELKTLIIDVLNLEGVTPDDIKSEEDLFGNEGLSLDSIDALEIGVALQRRYGVKIDPEDKNLNAHFKSVRALAAYMSAAR
ncbi:MAG: phosphopantetheine-binding protein [Terricaulis sp.]